MCYCFQVLCYRTLNHSSYRYIFMAAIRCWFGFVDVCVCTCCFQNVYAQMVFVIQTLVSVSVRLEWRERTVIRVCQRHLALILWLVVRTAAVIRKVSQEEIRIAKSRVASASKSLPVTDYWGMLRILKSCDILCDFEFLNFNVMISFSFWLFSVWFWHISCRFSLHCKMEVYSLYCDIVFLRSCKPGIAGRRCNKCHTGYYGFPRCIECSCDKNGVTSDICDQRSATCLCKVRDCCACL